MCGDFSESTLDGFRFVLNPDQSEGLVYYPHKVPRWPHRGSSTGTATHRWGWTGLSRLCGWHNKLCTSLLRKSFHFSRPPRSNAMGFDSSTSSKDRSSTRVARMRR